ncbi:MAG: hypothetical protein GWO20_15635 [Candidatus Korarchaeota archaeon]|nr:hypothetical protein [Candidatus Korarchaeota archaeon]NIU84828.1 hypothetical protein [Candidatus Thorarchaeota archaeon]NIW14839.1 hypothetical protein [Candidatus Thorarchaeota archaeon]NIW52887.1 hypothetical protein [Candidatus Korarchaeota archaeon]
MIKEILKRTLREYNELRSPYATATLLTIDSDEFKVQFEGHFARSCCMDEYFLDLMYDLKEKGIETKFQGFEHVGVERFVAEYKILKR